jgi:hypothetical protein
MDLAYRGETQAMMPAGIGGDYHPPTITTRLKAQKESLEKNLVKVNEALDLLEKNPEVQKCFDAISKVNY